MLCPKCLRGEIDKPGLCPLCGFQVPAGADSSAEELRQKKDGNADRSGLIEIDYSSNSPDSQGEEKDLPEWRQEVARRLLEIKQKRQALPNGDRTEVVLPQLPFPEVPMTAAQPQAPASAKAPGLEERLSIQPVSRSEVKSGATIETTLNGSPNSTVLPALRAMPTSRTPKPKAEPRPAVDEKKAIPPAPKVAQGDASDIQRIIDNTVLKKAVPQYVKPPAPASAAILRVPPVPFEDKLVLLSRAFAGMVDLIIIVFCTLTFVFAADAFSGIIVVDAVSWLIYCLLFLATYFVYSLFFLGTTNQTIGMMITNLRIVGEDEGRPRMQQVLKRSSGFLPSLLIAGIGLLWGVFDRRSRCLHDRLSGTHVVRI
jgi:uncharacterized RDD family membrane protein YckC